MAAVTHHSGGGHVNAGHGTWGHVVGDMAQNYAVSKGRGQVLSQRHLRRKFGLDNSFFKKFKTHLKSGLDLVPEVVDVLVLHGGPLRLPLGGEGDAGRPLVHGLAIAGGLTGAQPEHVTCYTSSQRVLQCYNALQDHNGPSRARGQDCLQLREIQTLSLPGPAGSAGQGPGGGYRGGGWLVNTGAAIRGGVTGGGGAGGWGRSNVRRGTSRAGPGPPGALDLDPVHVGDDGLLLGALDVADAGPGLALVTPGVPGLGVVTTDAAPGARVGCLVTMVMVAACGSLLPRQPLLLFELSENSGQ